MSRIAVGSYLKFLRNERRLSLADIASACGTNETQIIRIEAGRIDTRASLLMRIINVVKGDASDVLRLSLHEECDGSEELSAGIDCAKDFLKRDMMSQVGGEGVWIRLTHDQIEILKIAIQMENV